MIGAVGRLRLVLAMLAATVPVVGLNWGYQEYQAARTSLSQARESLGSARSSLQHVDALDVPSMVAVCQSLRGIDHNLSELTARLDRVGPLVALAQNLPHLSQASRDGEALLRAGHLTAESAVMLCDGLQPLQEAMIAGGSMEAAVQALAEGQPRFEGALANAREAGQYLGQLREAGLKELGPEAAAAADVLHRTVPELEAVAGLLVVTPLILGADRERTYLVLSQNRDELRPTGGFIGTAGTVSVRNGGITRLDYGSSVQHDTLPHQRVPPPEPLARYLHTTYWHLRDSNWWPDFRASAEQALYFYGLRNEALPDGIIALDQEAVRRLLQVVGPVFVPEFDEAVTAENLDERLSYHVHTYFREDAPTTVEAERKAFVGRLSEALVRRLLESPASQLPEVGKAVGTALQDKHLLVYMREPAVQAALGLVNWDGAMLRAPSDYLFVVNTNLSANKINRYVRERASYSLATETGQLFATLRYTVENQFDQVQVGSERLSTYVDFLRVYVPPGSTLLASSGFEAPPAVAEECGQTSFAGTVEVPANSIRTITLHYRLPAEVARDLEAGRYSLTLQHQPGLGAVAWEVAVADRSISDRITGDRLLRLADGELAFAPTTALRHLVAADPRPKCEIVTQEPTPLAAPARVRIPSIGVDAQVVELGVTPDGVMEAPDRGDVAGWYTSSARPGWPGNVVMSGHVDWQKRPAVFVELGNLALGEQIEVVAEDGRLYRYIVAESNQFRVDEAPIVRLVGPTARAALTLITCEGPFDSTRGEYLDRRVLRAYLADDPETILGQGR